MLLQVDCGSAARKGTRSSALSDGCAIGPDMQAMSVVSGIGTHPGISAAVQSVIETMSAIENPFSMKDLIAEAKGKLGTANARLRARGIPTGTVFAASCATLLVQGGRFAALWTGNARVYHMRDGVLQQITRDHVDRMMTSMVTKALGADLQPAFDATMGEMRAGDRFLICSASLPHFVEPGEMEETLRTAETAQQAADHLIQDALIGGSNLDVAAIAAIVSPKSAMSQVSQ